MPQSMRRRQSNQLIGTDSDSTTYRADSVASAETFMTTASNYETPRSATMSAHSSMGYAFTPRYTDAPSMAGWALQQQQPQRHFAYQNDAFMLESLDSSGGAANGGMHLSFFKQEKY